MRTRTVFQDCLLTATLVAAPAVCLASDAPVLSSAAPSVPRQVVPKRPDAGRRVPAIQQVQYQPASGGHFSQNQRPAQPQVQVETSTVNAELTRIFQQNGRPVPPLRPTTAVIHPQANDGGIALVQHQADVRGMDQDQKRPGFLKRLFGKLKGNKLTAENDKPWINSEPGPKLPAPPPIVYQTDSGNVNGVPAQTAGFSQPGHAASKDSSSAGRAARAAQQPAQKSGRRPLPDDGFINPFEDEAPTSEDTLLDLESLVRRRSADTAPPEQDPSVSEPPVEASVTDTSATPESNAESVAADAGSKNGPFTGYQLPSESEVLGMPEPVQDTSAASATQTKTAVGQDSETVDANEPAVIRVPLLEEPEMALPTFVETTEETDAEPVVPDSQPEPAAIEVEQSVQSAAEAVSEAAPQADAKPAQEPQSVSGAEPESLPEYSGLPNLGVLDDQAKRDQQRYRIMARTGRAGFKGFCPVELRDHRELIDSREQFTAKFGLQTYHFSSPEAKSVFEANPARYAPAGGGCDVVLLVNTGEETAGSLDFSLWYRDRLYMFRSRETQAVFSQDPRRYADQY